jgi:hypothetical protein
MSTQCAVNLQAMSMSTGFSLQVCGKLTGNEHEYGIFVAVCGKLTGNENEYRIFVAGMRQTYRQ